MVFKRRLSLVMQESHDDCAVACFVMVAKYYGHRCNIMACKKLNGNTKAAAQFSRLAAYFDIKVRAVRIITEDLQRAKRPAILYFGNNHFVVFSEANEQGVIIYDPATGIRLCSWMDLHGEFSGIIFEFVYYGKTKYRHYEVHRIKIKDWLKLTNDMRRGRFMQFMCILALDASCCMLIPLSQQLINTRADPELKMLVMHLVILCLIISMAQSFNDWFKKRLLIVISESWVHHVKSALLQYILYRPLSTYNQMTRADWYFYLVLVDELKIFLFEKWIPGLWDLVLIVSIVIILFICYSPWIGLIVISMLVQLLITCRYMKRRIQSIKIAIQRKNMVDLVSWQLLSSVKMMRVNAANDFFHNHWIQYQQSSQQNEIKLAHDSENSQLVRRLVSSMEQLFILLIALVAVRDSLISLGGMMGLYVVKMQIQQRFANVLALYESWRTLTVSSNRLAALFTMEPDIKPCHHKEQHQLSGKLTVEGLSAHQFLHLSSVFENISFSLEQGERLVITGASGCGKTTLLYLILGLYPVSGGILRLDDFAFSKWTVADYGDSISCILQDDYLWHGTLLDNILFQTQTIDWDYLNLLIDNLHLRQMIEQLNMGIYTPVGEGRCQFSSGQLQRIYLARALYKKPRFLFLDEATSHLDANTERDIDNYLRRSAITQIVITHNENLASGANRILHISSSS